MKIEFNIDINGDEAKQLAGILKSSASGLNASLVPYASAAAQEYVGMILGQKVFTRGSDIMEYRLFLLIRTAFGNKLPDEQRVCDLFQCTLRCRSGVVLPGRVTADLHGLELLVPRVEPSE
jgi:hypothetical protein